MSKFNPFNEATPKHGSPLVESLHKISGSSLETSNQAINVQSPGTVDANREHLKTLMIPELQCCMNLVSQEILKMKNNLDTYTHNMAEMNEDIADIYLTMYRIYERFEKDDREQRTGSTKERVRFAREEAARREEGKVSEVSTEEVSDIPEEVSEQAEVVSEVPEGVSETPDEVSEVPEGVSEIPEEVSETPEEVSELPEEISEAHEIVSEIPEELEPQAAAANVDPSINNRCQGGQKSESVSVQPRHSTVDTQQQQRVKPAEESVDLQRIEKRQFLKNMLLYKKSKFTINLNRNHVYFPELVKVLTDIKHLAESSSDTSLSSSTSLTSSSETELK